MKATGPVDDAGELYCMDTKGVVTTKDTGFTLVNGLSWSPDDKTMYYTDSWKVKHMETGKTNVSLKFRGNCWTVILIKVIHCPFRFL